MILKIGIIGTGSIATNNHAPAINALKNSKLIGVLSRDKKRGQDFLKKHNIVNGRVHTSLERFSKDNNIDLVIICSPDRLHFKQAYTCLKEGKHVLLEKPMTTSIEDAIILKVLAKEKNLVLKTGFTLRFHNGHKKLYKQIIEKKKIGEIRHIRIIRAFPQQDNLNWRAKNEFGKWWSLAAVGSHCFDLVRWFGQDMNEWKKFSSIIDNNKWDSENDEKAIILGLLYSNITVEIISSVQFGPYSKIELFGDSGIAICDDTLNREGSGKIILNNKELSFKNENPFINQLKNMILNIKHPEKYKKNDSGLRNVKDLIKSIN